MKAAGLSASVVIEDKLGLADQLEQQMQYVIDTYHANGKTTIENEAKLKRFRHFINSDQSDDNVVFVEERGQIRPPMRKSGSILNLSR
jgi:nitrite reductase (NADH) large subunit